MKKYNTLHTSALKGLTFEKSFDETYDTFTVTYFDILLVGHNQSGTFKVMNHCVFGDNETLRDYVEYMITEEFNKLKNKCIEAI